MSELKLRPTTLTCNSINLGILDSQARRGKHVTSGGLPSLESLPAGAADRVPECCAVEIFPQVHEREECIEDAGLHFVSQV